MGQTRPARVLSQLSGVNLMDLEAERPTAFGSRFRVRSESRAWLDVAAILLLVVGCCAFFAYLLARYPYDGLYGQDSYAYYYQARALLHDITGVPLQGWQLFTSDGLYHWPIGYHLLLMLGMLFGYGPAGGRAITLLMSVGATVVLYLLTGSLLKSAPRYFRVLAGLVAGAALPLTATYTRVGLSLMADVPALFLGLLGLYCVVRAWPRVDAAHGQRTILWATMGGFALGLAVLTRYGEILLLVPVAVCLLFRWPDSRSSVGARGFNSAALVPAFLAFGVALVPQLLYIVTHQNSVDVGYSSWLAGWTPENIFRTTVTSVDGTSTFAQPMIVFYLLQPLYDTDAGFLSLFFLPALLIGTAYLVLRRRWLLLVLCYAWWLLPAVFFAGTPYQTQRFVLVYLPAILIVIGVGVSCLVGLLFVGTKGYDAWWRAALAVLAIGIICSCVVGVYKQQGSVRGWMDIQTKIKAEERQVVDLTEKAAGAPENGAAPRVVAFGATAAIYHYTRWPVLELYDSDQDQIANFLQPAAPHLVVVPVGAMDTQWKGTPVAARWAWLQLAYTLVPRGNAGEYAVFELEPKQ
jgi:4-amino-4-deoxy-L-arabinose transferase-like glycosyltransferase